MGNLQASRGSDSEWVVVAVVGGGDKTAGREMRLKWEPCREKFLGTQVVPMPASATLPSPGLSHRPSHQGLPVTVGRTGWKSWGDLHLRRTSEWQALLSKPPSSLAPQWDNEGCMCSPSSQAHQPDEAPIASYSNSSIREFTPGWLLLSLHFPTRC